MTYQEFSDYCDKLGIQLPLNMVEHSFDPLEAFRYLYNIGIDDAIAVCEDAPRDRVYLADHLRRLRR